MAKKVVNYNLSESLAGAQQAKIEVDMADGNLMIDALPGGAELAGGTLQYLENQERPACSANTSGGRTTLTLKSGSKGQPWFRMPWSACNGATQWHVHLNPTVALEIAARSGGGNIRLDLAGLTVTRLTTETGGGNIDVFLPDQAAGLRAVIKTGAGNVTLHLPAGVAARVQATTGLGKVIVDGPYSQAGQSTYQSPGYENSLEKLEIVAGSGAGNVYIQQKIGHLAPAGVPA